LETLSFNGVDHVWYKVVNGLLKRIVSESDCATGIKALLESSWSGRFARPVEGVDITLDNVVSKATERGKHLVVVREVRDTHISWEFADDAEKSSLKLSHFALNTSLGEGGKISMVPTKCVRKPLTSEYQAMASTYV
jgi:hypothetical protein